ncbi:MAG: hypothetical protein L0220_08895 [Acidobacteria bacterium]|nr:hypothetical protein [Acidobacteriota bacterium]
MNLEHLIVIALNILVGVVVIIILYSVTQGLKRELQTLSNFIESQSDQLDVIGKRIAETEKAGNIYKSLIDELPEAVDKYNEVIRKTKETVTEELDKANQSKDEKLKLVAELRLKEIEVVQPVISQLSTLSEILQQTMTEVRTQLRSLENISHMAPTLDLGTMWSRLTPLEESGLASHMSSILSGTTGKASTGSGRFKPYVVETAITKYEPKTAIPTEKNEGKKEDK